MRRTALSKLLVAYWLGLSGVSALQVTPGSSCASTCLSASSTTTASEIVCDDSDYFSPAGVKFKDCLECLQTSEEATGSESDSSWLIYNLRFASAVCLYDYPKHEKNSTSSCDLGSACLPLQTALETGLALATSPSSAFGYCSADNSAFYGTSIDDCVSCLQSSSDTYGANFLLALQAGCEQQPANGTLLSISGDIFSQYPINFTSSSSTASSTSSSTHGATLSQGGIVGIALTAGGLLIAAAMLFGIHWRRQKRWQKEDDVTFVDPHDFYGKGFPSGGGGASASSYHHHHHYQPRFTYDHKSPPPTYQPTTTAAAAAGRDDFELDYTNNADYYDRMEGKSRGRPLQPQLSPSHRSRPSTAQAQPTQLTDEFHSAAHVDAAALPTHPAYIPRDRLTPSRAGSHRSTPPSSGGGARSSAAAAAEERFQQQQRQRQPKYNKPDPYTIQVYLNSVEDARAPPPVPSTNPLSQHPTDGISRDVGINRETTLREVKIELAGPAEMSAATTTTGPPPPSSYEYEYHRRPSTSTDNYNNYSAAQHLVRQGGRTTPIPRSNTPASGRGTPAPGGGAPRIPSLILPSMSRLRGSSKKPPKLSINHNNNNYQSSNHETQAAPLGSNVHQGRGASFDITGPLAFPDLDSRFTRQRAGDDCIVEQTVDRAAHPHIVEVPIASGKSYLYG